MSDSRSLVVRAVWYLFIGWWATGLWLSVAWFLNVTIVGLPLGLKMISMVPKVLSLKEPKEPEEFMVEGKENKSPNFFVRGAYFLLVGWWASLVWMGLGYVVSLTVIGIPIAIKMYNKLPYITSLKKY